MTLTTLLAAILTAFGAAALIAAMNGRDGRPKVPGFDFARAKEQESGERFVPSRRTNVSRPRP